MLSFKVRIFKNRFCTQLCCNDRNDQPAWFGQRHIICHTQKMMTSKLNYVHTCLKQDWFLSNTSSSAQVSIKYMYSKFRLRNIHKSPAMSSFWSHYPLGAKHWPLKYIFILTSLRACEQYKVRRPIPTDTTWDEHG